MSSKKYYMIMRYSDESGEKRACDVHSAFFFRPRFSGKTELLSKETQRSLKQSSS